VKPPRLEPMLATPWPNPFSDDEWLFEPKWDGIRGVVAWDGASASIHTRRGNEVSARYPELAPLGALPPCVLDGEIVALDERGVPSFGLLQQRMNRISGRGSGPPVSFIAFDLLHLAGHPLVSAPLEGRIARLASLDLPEPYGRVEPTGSDGLALWEVVQERDLEGMVAKRLGSLYRPGVRSPDWRKIHNTHTARVLVGGFTAGEGGRASTFGSLLLGMRGGDALRWVGAVGTGFSDDELEAIRAALDEMRVDRSPFHPDAELPSDAAWVEPRLIAAVRYRNWTAAHRLRHPVFKGFTDDDPVAITWEAEGPG